MFFIVNFLPNRKFYKSLKILETYRKFFSNDEFCVLNMQLIHRGSLVDSIHLVIFLSKLFFVNNLYSAKRMPWPYLTKIQGSPGLVFMTVTLTAFVGKRGAPSVLERSLGTNKALAI